MSFDEEHIDPHGECAHEIARLKKINSHLLTAAQFAYAAMNSEDGREYARKSLFAAIMQATQP